MKIETAFDNARNFASNLVGDSADNGEISSKSPLLVSPCGTMCHWFYNGDNDNASENWMAVDKLFKKKKKAKKAVNPRTVATSWANTNPARQTMVKFTPERVAVLDKMAENVENERPTFEGVVPNELKQYRSEIAFASLLHSYGHFEDFDESED